MDTLHTTKNDESDVNDKNGYQKNGPEEIKIPVPWGYIYGKWWGPRWVQPILALHGRQDNAGSFDTLIPLLPDDVSILCLDMPGHGLSSHYPKLQYYYVYWDGVIILRKVIKYFKWNKVKLLGHSLGGAISFLYAASYPKEVDFLISLDIVSPTVRDVTKSIETTGDHIDKFLKYEQLTLDNTPVYDYSEMIDIVVNAYNGSIDRNGAKILMKRGIQPSYTANKFYFSRDPRLKVSSLGMLSLDLILAYASKIKCAYLNIRAVPGMEFEQPENYQKVLDQIKLNSIKFQYHEVNGTHHVHLMNPERVAPIITDFLQH
ncbi:PREDICTED: probable serine hydrolase isoform X2 [Polistes dominula]|uniref:Probable serine hydrolase isoform X2 n=1 Tax=Polistes dominula TaxID=743375 RepID=A0ABM1IIV4_POLDO|nr:PREDICTED: probable serine hydrolase isoform X2 [Polistes dominula]